MRVIDQNPAVGGWTWEISQLANGVIDVERTVVPFDSGFIGSVTVDRAALHQIRAAPGWGLVLVPAVDSGAVFVDGRRVVAGDAVFLPQACDLELLTHGVGRIHLIASRSLVAGSRLRLHGPSWYSRTDRRSSSLTDDMGAWLATAGSTADTHRAAALQSRLSAWLRSANVEAPHSGSEGQALSRRRMAVERVRRFVHEHLAEPMTLADLCHHAHLQARSLEYGFRDLVGLSPFKYIKMLRLGEVRRRLQASTAADCSVSQVALDCGFSHLSQFAADYKRAFLESPSATVRGVECPRLIRALRYGGAPAVAVAR